MVKRTISIFSFLIFVELIVFFTFFVRPEDGWDGLAASMKNITAVTGLTLVLAVVSSIHNYKNHKPILEIPLPLMVLLGISAIFWLTVLLFVVL